MPAHRGGGRRGRPTWRGRWGCPLSLLNLPVGLAGLLISVEPLIDMGRTALNVSNSMLAGVLTSRIQADLDVGTVTALPRQASA